MERLGILLTGLILDRLVGDPPALWKRVSHPVVVIGWAIDGLDRRLNRPDFTPETRRRAGFFALGLLLLGALILGNFVAALADAFGFLGMVVEALIVAVFLAQKSLVDHVRAVATALRTGGLPAGRLAVSQIVGRDPEGLDASAVVRAALESLAENASDGVIAPVLWYLVFGLPGLLAYKVVNTADSMIGHMNSRYGDFGYASAKLDDLMNFVPARATAVLFAAASTLVRIMGQGRPPGFRETMAVTRRDAPKHRSPNAGWPEVAMAVGLDVSLGGPRRYGELIVDAPLLNPAGRRDLTPDDLDRAIAAFDRAMAIVTALIALAMILALQS